VPDGLHTHKLTMMTPDLKLGEWEAILKKARDLGAPDHALVQQEENFGRCVIVTWGETVIEHTRE
jgi:hypothetical protein